MERVPILYPAASTHLVLNGLVAASGGHILRHDGWWFGFSFRGSKPGQEIISAAQKTIGSQSCR